MTVQDKDEKDLPTSRNATPPPPVIKNGIGGAGHLASPGLDLDLEELSGSLLVDEGLERAMRIPEPGAARTRSAPPPLPASVRPPAMASVPPPLPKPTPPPRSVPPPLPRGDSLPPLPRGDSLPPLGGAAPDLERTPVELADKLEPVDVEVTFHPEERAEPPAPPPSAPDTADTLVAPPPQESFSATSVDPEQALMRPVERAELLMPEPSPPLPSPLGHEDDLSTLQRSPLAPLFGPPPNGAQSRSAMPPPAEPEVKAGGKGARLALAGAGLVAVAAVVVGVVVQLRKPERGPFPRPSVVTVPDPRPPAPDPTPPAAVGCAVAGDPRVIAPTAIVAPGIEVRALGDEFAMGFASGDHHATLVRLDAASLSATSSNTKPWAQVIRRVTPFVGKKGKITLAIDADKKDDKLHGRRTLELDPPLQIGVSEKHLAWAPFHRKPAGKLWPLEGDTTIEAPRGARADASSSIMAIAFRSAGSLWVGEADDTGNALSAKGNLARLGGQGAMVGAPAIATSDGSVLMAWAERQSADEPWKLRWVRFKSGEAPGAAHAFELPAGGRGEQAMAPGIAPVAGGRFLLVWTEGPASAHEVRGLTLSNDGTPVGAPLRISAVGANAGQGQPAVTASGHGVVAFLEANGSAFQVVATPIRCAL